MKLNNCIVSFSTDNKTEIKIFAIPKDGSPEYEIDDLYWFEEQMIHTFDDAYNSCEFRIEVIVPV